MVDELTQHALLQDSIPDELTPRQRAVLFGLIQGKCEKQIAGSLGLSVHTVHIYIKGIYEEYGVHSRTELFSQCILRLLRVYDQQLESQSPWYAEQEDGLNL
jgi:DNA-binding NarL/FixJ family response regulator